MTGVRGWQVRPVAHACAESQKGVQTLAPGPLARVDWQAMAAPQSESSTQAPPAATDPNFAQRITQALRSSFSSARGADPASQLGRSKMPIVLEGTHTPNEG